MQNITSSNVVVTSEILTPDTSMPYHLRGICDSSNHENSSKHNKLCEGEDCSAFFSDEALLFPDLSEVVKNDERSQAITLRKKKNNLCADSLWC